VELFETPRQSLIFSEIMPVPIFCRLAPLRALSLAAICPSLLIATIDIVVEISQLSGNPDGDRTRQREPERAKRF